MRFAPVLLCFFLLCSPLFAAKMAAPNPTAASLFDDFSGFFSGILQWFGVAGAEKSPCSLEAVATPSEGGRADAGAGQTCGGTARLTAYPAFGYDILNWSSSGCEIIAANYQNAVVRLAASGTCRVTAAFGKPEAKGEQGAEKNDGVKITEFPSAERQEAAVPGRCPKEIQETGCGDFMAQTSPIFIGADGCPRKCRTAAKCASSTPIEVECSTIATVGSWSEGGCNYACKNAPAADGQDAGTPASETGSNSSSGGGAASGVPTTGGTITQVNISIPSGGSGGGTTGGSSGGGGGAVGGGSTGGGSGGSGGGSSGGSSGGTGGGTTALPDYTAWITYDAVPCVPGQQTAGAFYVYVKNIGQAIGPSYELKEWLNSLPSATSQKAGLIPGEQVQTAARPVCQQGGNTYHAQVDPNNLIAESDETNNVASNTMQWNPTGGG